MTHKEKIQFLNIVQAKITEVTDMKDKDLAMKIGFEGITVCSVDGVIVGEQAFNQTFKRQILKGRQLTIKIAYGPL